MADKETDNGAVSENQIRSFLGNYGEALSAGDLPKISSCWAIPALVLSDEGAEPVTDAGQVESFFEQAIAWYRSQGLVSTRPQLHRFLPLTERLFAVDVLWRAFDEAGVERSNERSHYILRLEDGTLRIQVALTTTAPP